MGDEIARFRLAPQKKVMAITISTHPLASGAQRDAERSFRRTLPEIHGHALKPLRLKIARTGDLGHFYPSANAFIEQLARPICHNLPMCGRYRLSRS